jgi:hypothetical protein
MKLTSVWGIHLGHRRGSLDMLGLNLTRRGDRRQWELLRRVCEVAIGALTGVILLWRRNGETSRRGLGRQRHPVLPRVDVQEPPDLPDTRPDVAPDERRADPIDLPAPIGPSNPGSDGLR